jgi:hypothetical protein
MNVTPQRSRRRIAGVGLTLAIAAASAAAIVSPGTARAREGTNATDRVIVCESGVISNDGVDTSSAFAVRAAAGDPVPTGCRES